MEYKIQSKTYYNIYDLLIQNRSNTHALFLRKYKKKIPTADRLETLKDKLKSMSAYDQSKIFEIGALISIKEFKDLTDDIFNIIHKTL